MTILKVQSCLKLGNLLFLLLLVNMSSTCPRSFVSLLPYSFSSCYVPPSYIFVALLFSPQVEQQTEAQPQESFQTDSGPVEYAMEQERRLVEEITTPGGIKPAPPRDSLNNFISR